MFINTFSIECDFASSSSSSLSWTTFDGQLHSINYHNDQKKDGKREKIGRIDHVAIDDDDDRKKMC